MKFTFKITAEFDETLDNVISSLLPHTQFNVDDAKKVVEELFKTLPLSETEGLYYVFLKLLERLNIAGMYINNYSTVLRREVFDNALSAGIRSLIILPEFNAKTFFEAYGKSYNLDIPEEYDDGASFAYSVCIEKYDELFEKQVPTAEGLTWIQILKEKMDYGLTAKMLSLAASTLTEGVASEQSIKRGPGDARAFLADSLAVVNSRIDTIYSASGDRNTETAICDIKASKEFDVNNRINVKDLFYTGIDPIDDVLPVRTQDIITVVADEGIGKTRFAIWQTYRALISGANVLYICGETAQLKIKKSIEAAHIFQRYGLQLRWSEVADPSSLVGLSIEEMEDTEIKINSSVADLYENPDYGRLVLLQSADYETFIDKITTINDKYQIDLVVVDHVLALGCTGGFTTSGRLVTPQMRVTYLYECEDLLVKSCNVAFINTSHPSVETSNSLKNGKTPGARSGAESANSTRYSSIVMVLNNTPEQRKQDIVLLYVTKLRDEPNTSNVCVLKRQGYANIHVYDPKLQYLEGDTDKDMDMDSLMSLFMEDTNNE